MKATEILMQEHRVIERVLDALDLAAGRIGTSEAVGPSFFLEAADFIRSFADGLHHMKEEDVFFEALVVRGMPRHAGPIAVMLFEHEEGRKFTRGMADAAAKWAAGDASAKADVVHNATSYTELLRQHIQKEDNILFMMAEEVLPPEEQERIVEDFARVERQRAAPDAPARYRALAARLEEAARR